MLEHDVLTAGFILILFLSIMNLQVDPPWSHSRPLCTCTVAGLSLIPFFSSLSLLPNSCWSHSEYDLQYWFRSEYFCIWLIALFSQRMQVPSRCVNVRHTWATRGRGRSGCTPWRPQNYSISGMASVRLNHIAGDVGIQIRACGKK